LLLFLLLAYVTTVSASKYCDRHKFTFLIKNYICNIQTYSIQSMFL